jgi:tRNA G37 N-methylase Trm5
LWKLGFEKCKINQIEDAETFFASAESVVFQTTLNSADVWMGHPKMQPKSINQTSIYTHK